MDPANNEYVIKIKDVFYAILRKLWLMVLAGVIAGVALFSYYVMQVVKTNDVLDVTKKVSAGESEDQYKLRVQRIEKARDIYQLIEKLNQQIDNEQNYISNSLYMRIDPNNTYFSTVQYTLTVENNDTNGIDKALLVAFEREFKYGDYLNEYAEEIGENPEYIREIIGFSTEPADSTVVVENADSGSVGSLYIFVYGPSREFVDNTMDVVIANIETVSKELNSTIAPHKLSFVGVQKFSRVDNVLREGQNSHYEHIKTYRDQIITFNTNLDTLASDLGLSSKTPLINYIKNHDAFSVTSVPTETSEKAISRRKMIKPNLKWFGIGFGAGAVVIAVFVVIGYIFGKKILTQAQFFGLFRTVKKIGVMKPLGKRSKYIRFIDVKTEDDTKSSVENCNGIISSNYSNLTKDLNRVLITGTGDSKAMSEAVKNLGLKGDFKPDIFSNPQVLKSVPDYDGIVLIEQRKYSIKTVVENEIDLLSNAGTKIVGAIII